MALNLVSWALAVWLVVLSLSVAVPVWKQAGTLSGPSRRSLLAGLLETASIAGILRLISPWSSGSVVLWVVAVVALAAAVAGAVLRWPDLPRRTSKPARAAGEAAETEVAEPAEVAAEVATAAPANVATARAPANVATANVATATEPPAAEQTRRPSLAAREARVVPIPGKPRRKSKAGKKLKKEPGNLALAGQVALLAAVVVFSFLGG
ncbi:hypothetical protein GD627_06280 [Arthrobacter yangruifuii]|uniref:Transmembrane protein n=1 Tax=Arthrobacter yangruifuii TaxID=2606616 RepID=A0A5N6MRT3_9MICC|nr:hypothetical protein [Arthrobacter yangruifuii]KAD4007168.1 hypothetical protein GD627_06280 [Arthrobacter yangruifuii]